MIQFLVTLGVLMVVILLTLMASYNGLMSLRHQVRAAWRKMDDQLKQRYDLLPGFVNAVQAADAVNSAPLSAVVNAKNQAAVAFNPPQLAQAEAALSRAIHSVFAIADNEPALKSDARFNELRQQLIASETSISQSRQQYNDRVLSYNAAMGSFPHSLTSRVFSFPSQPTFDIPDGKLI